MAELSEPQKEQIILMLARFRAPAEVAVAMKAEFDLELGIPQIVKYDPTRPAFEAGEKWRPIFDAAREAYLTDVKAVPCANQGFRLAVLQEGIDAAKKSKNWKLVAALMEQAAKEVGGVLTNARELNIKDDRRARNMTPEDRAVLLGSIIAEKLEAAKDQQPTIQ